MTPLADRPDTAPPPFSAPTPATSAGPPPPTAPQSSWPDEAYRGWASL